MNAEWTQTLIIIATIISSVYYVHRDIVQEIKVQATRIDAQAARSDKLYEMFIDLLKEKK